MNAAYQLPEGTYRELIVKPRMAKLPKERLSAMLRRQREWRQFLPEDEAEVARREISDEQQLKAAELAEREVAAGRPIVVQAWQVQVSSRAHTWVTAPRWLTTPAIHGGAATVRVFADDTCEPASF